VNGLSAPQMMMHEKTRNGLRKHGTYNQLEFFYSIVN
jgi:hypothetical protein